MQVEQTSGDSHSMPILDSLCRKYQTIFQHSHPEEAKLVELHSTGKQSEFLDAYFKHEYEKGQVVVDRFRSINSEWTKGHSLDFGCGAGGLSVRIAENTTQTTGIDIEKYKLDFAKGKAKSLGRKNVDFIYYDGEAVPFEDGSFDSLFCIDVVEHLPTPEKFLGDFYRLLKPGGLLLLSFGPPWCHAHGKHMWAKLPGWWTHLIFPSKVVMRVSGFPEDTTWEQLGMHRLTVSKFEKIIKTSGFEVVHIERLIKRLLTPLRAIPFIRELFISEVVGVFRKPHALSPACWKGSNILKVTFGK